MNLDKGSGREAMWGTNNVIISIEGLNGDETGTREYENIKKRGLSAESYISKRKELLAQVGDDSTTGHR